MTDVSPFGSVVLIISGFWAVSNIVLGNAKLSNERRDIVIIGKIGSDVISEDHRKLILYNDWLPMSLANISVSALFGILLIFLAKYELLDLDINRKLCYIFSVVPLLGSVALAVNMVSEFRNMQKVLTTAVGSIARMNVE